MSVKFSNANSTRFFDSGTLHAIILGLEIALGFILFEPDFTSLEEYTNKDVETIELGSTNIIDENVQSFNLGCTNYIQTSFRMRTDIKKKVSHKADHRAQGVKYEQR